MRYRVYDLIVIGGGPAGYVGAIKASQLGKKVAIIEKDKFGGTCLNRGCIPTKTYLKNAEIIENLKKAKERGIEFDSTFSMDMKKTISYKNSIVEKLTSGVKYLLDSNEVDIYRCEGYLVPKISTKKMLADDRITGKKEKDSLYNLHGVRVGEDIIFSEKVLIAGGSKVRIPDIKGIESDKVLTSDEILDLEDIPEELVIIGSGVIGLEMAMIFNSYGTKVTVIKESTRNILGMDKEVSDYIKAVCEKKGIEFFFGCPVTEFTDSGDKITVNTVNGNFRADKVLIAIGRKPDFSALKYVLDTENKLEIDELSSFERKILKKLEHIDLKKVDTKALKMLESNFLNKLDIGILEKVDRILSAKLGRTDENFIKLDKGCVKVDKYLETSIHGVYAVGDVNGKMMLAHAAFKMAEIAVQNAFSRTAATKKDVNYHSIPLAVYIQPEIAQVGMTEEEAKANGYDVLTGRFDFSVNGRAMASGETEGFVKVVVEKKYKEILGVCIIGPCASEIINEAAVIIENELTLFEAIKVVRAHPSYTEALLEALMDSVGKAIHLPKKK